MTRWRGVQPARLLAALILFGCWMPGRATAQLRVRPAGADATLEPSPAAESLLKRARQAIERADWKLAVDSLQRIIDDHGGALLERAPGLYESGLTFGHRLIARLPAEGLAAYRLLNDGRAKAALQQARRNHDQGLLRWICDHYLLTSSGDDAAALLASWFLDEGRSAEALELLDRVAALCPAMSVPPEVLASRRALALAMMGRPRAARASVERAAEHLGADTRARVLELVDALAAARPDGGAWAGSWPGVAGGGDRRGVMPPVVPTLVSELPWRRRLIDARPEDSLARSDSTGGGVAAPVLFPVVAGNRLFVKGVGRCAALDADTFELLWESEPEVEGLAGRFARRRTGALRLRPEPEEQPSRVDRLRYDYVGAALSVVGDLLFAVERTGSGERFDADGVAVWLQPDRARRTAAGSRLVALDVATGRVRWQRGRSTRASDPLAAVEFLAPPLGVNGELWVPALLGGELAMLVLDPSAGELLHRIGLCVPGAEVSPQVALWPALAGDTVYVPTGQGWLFALDAAAHTPRWAVRYPRSIPVAWQGIVQQPMLWWSTPPVVTGTLVLLAPGDGDALYAFERATGELRWSLPRERHRYVVAAAGDRAWLAGRSVTCLSIDRGTPLWSFTPPPMCGRAVLSGERIYLPTPGELIALDAATGEELASLPMPAGHQPLGNLLALPDALLSVDNVEVRKYPDLDRAYQRAVAANRAEPGNAAQTLRLAWMELLRGTPGRCLRALTPFEPQGALADHARRDQAVHLRVEALLALAGEQDQTQDEAITWLDRAVREALAPDDRLRAAFALGNRLERGGRLEEAYRCFWRLGRSEAADLPMQSEEGVERRALSVIAPRLAAIEAGLSEEARTRLTRWAADTVRTASADLRNGGPSGGSVQVLRSLGGVGAPAGWDQAALIELAHWNARRRKYEPAEQDYRAAIRRNRDPARTAEALLGLAEMYLQPEQSLVVLAGDCLDRLEREFPSVVVSPPDGAESSTVAEQVGRLRARLGPAALAAHRAALAPGPFRLAARPAWPAGPGPGSARLIEVAGERTEPLADRVLVAVADDLLRAHRVTDGALEWEAQLRLPHQFQLQESLTRPPTAPETRRCAAVDGQTLVVGCNGGVHAVGLLTGKRLWSVQRKAGDGPWALLPSNGLVAAADGRVAYLSEPGRLAVVDARDGAALWQRDIDIVLADAVVIADRHVLVVDAEYTGAQAFRLADGGCAATFTFSQPEPGQRLISLIQERGILCGPDGSAVVAYEVASGAERWRLEVPEGLGSLFQVSADRIGVGSMSGRLRLADIASGSVEFDRTIDDCALGIADGMLEGTLLIVGGATGAGGAARWALVGVDIAAGQPRWSRTDLAAVSHMPWFFDAARGVIPALVTPGDRVPGAGSSNAAPRAVLALLDTATGGDFGPVAIPVDGPAGGWRVAGPDGVWREVIPGSGPAAGHLTGELAVWPGCLVVGTRGGTFAIGTVPAAEHVE